MSFTCHLFLYHAWCCRAVFFHCGCTVCSTAGLSPAAAMPLWVFFQQNCFYLAASGHLSQESRASPFCCFAKILKLTSLYSEQFCPELMRFLTCLRIPRIKPLSLGRGRFSKIISNSLNHHGSRKRESSTEWKDLQIGGKDRGKNTLFPPFLHQYFRKKF